MTRVLAFVIGIVAGLGLYLGWYAAQPNDHWFRVRTITVSDGKAGGPITLAVDRTIYRPFRARWIATVRRLTPDGLETSCIGRGENDYHPGAALPRPLTIGYWLNNTCVLEPGQYRLTTLWTIEAWPSDRDVRAESNVFRVE